MAGKNADDRIKRLSDDGVRHIARRIAELQAGAAPQAPAETPAAAPMPDEALDATALLGDIDAWNLRRQGEWYVFQASIGPRELGTRQYRRLVDPGSADDTAHVIADAPGALLGILSLGGARVAQALARTSGFPCHLLTPADDIGPVGMAGTAAAPQVSHLHHVREMTHDAVLAETLLAERFRHGQSLPLYMVRGESDASASVADLASGAAVANLLTAAQNLAASAARLGKPARLLCVRLDYGLEDVRSTPVGYRDGLLALMAQITAGLAGLGFRKPVFLAQLDCGTAEVSDHPAIRAQAELVWNHADHDLVFASPSYGFAQDSYGRPTAQGLQQMAEIEAAALMAVHGGTEWLCPSLLLAEREAGHRVRVKARAMGDLVLDAGDPFDAGPDAGFSFTGDTNGARIVSVGIDAEDPQDIILTLDRDLGDKVQLCYAIGTPPRASDRPLADYPAARGALREATQMRFSDGSPMSRWALPCALDVH